MSFNAIFVHQFDNYAFDKASKFFILNISKSIVYKNNFSNISFSREIKQLVTPFSNGIKFCP